MIDPAEVIEIKDPEIDVKEIMKKIREGIESRRDLYADGVFFPSLKESISDGLGSSSLGPEFNYQMQEALSSHDQVWVSSQVTPVRAPILGPSLAKLKRELHNLVIFYVNLLAAKQVSFNAHIVRAVSNLADVVASKAAEQELAQLRQEVRRLGDKVARLEEESKASRPPTSGEDDAVSR